MPWPHFTPGKDLVPIAQEAGWAAGPVWMGGKSRPHQDLIPDCPAHSQPLYQMCYQAHIYTMYSTLYKSCITSTILITVEFEVPRLLK